MLDTNGFWSETYTGKKYYPTDPKNSDISIHDIAHALANNCRYNGHCKEFYSIAAHSVLVSRFVETVSDDPKTLLAALLHDASEAYIHDIITPLKLQMPEYKELEAKWMEEIHKKFGIGEYDEELVKEADHAALKLEAYFLMGSHGVGWSFEETRFDDIVEYIKRNEPNTIDDLTGLGKNVLFRSRFSLLSHDIEYFGG